MRIFIIYLFVVRLFVHLCGVFLSRLELNEMLNRQQQPHQTTTTTIMSMERWEEHIMISLWQTSSNINFKFTTQAQCRPTNIQIYGHVHATHSGYTLCFQHHAVLSPFKNKTLDVSVCDIRFVFFLSSSSFLIIIIFLSLLFVLVLFESPLVALCTLTHSQMKQLNCKKV